jgi:hypothetical protein
VENNKLVPIPFFKTSKGMLSSISIDFDDQGPGEVADTRMHLSNDKQALYIPIINVGNRTSKYLVYKFDSTQFVFDKKAKQPVEPVSQE